MLLKDPHVSATSQGLDGLMIELADDKSKVVMTTISEDKCTDNPRDTFSKKSFLRSSIATRTSVLPSSSPRHPRVAHERNR